MIHETSRFIDTIEADNSNTDSNQSYSIYDTISDCASVSSRHHHPFSCENCDKVFTDPSNLQRHIRSAHVGARSHTCAECGKAFATSSGLKQHQHIHSSIKPFQCEVCLKAYTQFSNLCRHKRMHADCRQQIKCTDCGQAFSTTTSLSKHKRFCEGVLHHHHHHQHHHHPPHQPAPAVSRYVYPPLGLPLTAAEKSMPMMPLPGPTSPKNPSLAAAAFMNFYRPPPRASYPFYHPHLPHPTSPFSLYPPGHHLGMFVLPPFQNAKFLSSCHPGFTAAMETVSSATNGMGGQSLLQLDTHKRVLPRLVEERTVDGRAEAGEVTTERSNTVDDASSLTSGENNSLSTDNDDEDDDVDSHNQTISDCDSDAALSPAMGSERPPTKGLEGPPRKGRLDGLLNIAHFDYRKLGRSACQERRLLRRAKLAVRRARMRYRVRTTRGDVLVRAENGGVGPFKPALSGGGAGGPVEQPLDLSVRPGSPQPSWVKRGDPSSKKKPPVSYTDAGAQRTSLGDAAQNRGQETRHNTNPIFCSIRHHGVPPPHHHAPPPPPPPNTLFFEQLYHRHLHAAAAAAADKSKFLGFREAAVKMLTLGPKFHVPPGAYPMLPPPPPPQPHGGSCPPGTMPRLSPGSGAHRLATLNGLSPLHLKPPGAVCAGPPYGPGLSGKLKDRYSCRFCGKVFPRSANLTRHLRTHTGEQPYKCKYCERSFSISSNLQRHVRNIHNKEKPFKCPLCDRCFGQQTNLDRHLKKHESEGPNVVDSPRPDAASTADLDDREESYFSEIRHFIGQACSSASGSPGECSHPREPAIDAGPGVPPGRTEDEEDEDEEEEEDDYEEEEDIDEEEEEEERRNISPDCTYGRDDVTDDDVSCCDVVVAMDTLSGVAEKASLGNRDGERSASPMAASPSRCHDNCDRMELFGLSGVVKATVKSFPCVF